MRLIRYSYPAFRNASPSLGNFRYSPWAGLESEIDRLFQATLSGVDAATSSSRFPIDLFEDKSNTYVRAELPGVNRDDIKVEVVDGYLTISAVRKAASVAAGAGQTADATPPESSAFSRAVSIAEDTVAEKVSATYENGVLTVTLPKREEAKPKKVAVAIT